MALDYMTAGESHGPQLTAIMRGVPAGLAVTSDDVNRDLARRQVGYGRGGRMKIETDRAEFRSGVRKGRTLGSPITMVVANRDYTVWEQFMSPEPGELDPARLVTRPRPGHADLGGALKYNHHDARNILERASARETAARVAVGAVCKAFLAEFGIRIYSHVVCLGGVWVDATGMTHDDIIRNAEASDLRVARADDEARMRALIDKAKDEGDTVGGIFEVVTLGAPAGLGSCFNWDDRLDAKLAHGLMGLQAIKGVEMGVGFQAATRPGSQVHDPIAFTGDDAEIERMRAERGRGASGGFYHLSNNSGGVEGGMTNGEPIVVRAAMKPISTLMKPLASVDLETKEPFTAVTERSDVCAVPAAGVVGEAIVAFILAKVMLEKFGGDSVTETRRNYDGYCRQMRKF